MGPQPPGAGVSRRQVLRWGLVGGMLVAVPITLSGCGDDDPAYPVVAPPPTPIPSFLTSAEHETLRALVGQIIPTDELPGATEAAADVYIDRMLSIVPDADEPGLVFAGGPFSDRNPFANPDGTISTRHADNGFAHFLPLTRLQLLSWRVRVLGTAAVPGSDFNGPVKGWREIYRSGLAQTAARSRDLFGAEFPTLSDAQQAEVVAGLDASFVSLLTEHTIEGTLGAPEYGGNRNRIGWQLIGYDGDSQPLGYSIFDTATMTYRERADKPNSTADPGDSFSGVDASTRELLLFVVRTARPSFST